MRSWCVGTLLRSRSGRIDAPDGGRGVPRPTSGLRRFGAKRYRTDIDPRYRGFLYVHSTLGRRPAAHRAELSASSGVTRRVVRRTMHLVLVDRCWICLEQPAVTTVRAMDGREVPVCDICALEHPLGLDERITDDDLRRLLGDTA